VTADLIIRPLTPDLDWDQYLDLTARSFGPTAEARARANIGPIVADGRCLGAFEGNRMVGAALFHDMRQWWHGRAVPMAGVAGVKIAPEDRGRGIGRTVMTALLELMAGRGYPLAALYPATMTIYRSLGWEIAGHRQEVRLPARSLFALAKADVVADAGPPGDLRRPGPGDAAHVLDIIGHAYALARDCGPMTYDEATVRRWLTRPGRYADADRYAYLAPDGFLAYGWRRGHDEIVVEHVAAASAGTTRALWRVVASNSSVADTVHAQLSPSDPLWWLLPEQDASVADRRSWMLRLLDAPAAIAARGFPATDLAVPLRITDDLRPANSGLWQLTVRDGTGCLSGFRTGQGDSRRTDASFPGPGPGEDGGTGSPPVIGGPGGSSPRTASFPPGEDGANTSRSSWAPAAWPRCTRARRSRRCAGPAWPRVAARQPTPPSTARSPPRPTCSTPSEPFNATRRSRCGTGTPSACRFVTNRCSPSRTPDGAPWWA
jgi:predicted acetyltransferase